MRRHHLTILIVVLAAVMLTACGGNQPDPLSQAPPSATDSEPVESVAQETLEPVDNVSPTATPELFPGDGPWEVTFQTADGVNLHGLLYGKSTKGVILAPMYPGEQAGWQPFAEVLAGEGYCVLTFDFRGHGLSEGERATTAAPTDLAAAAAFLHEHGVEQVAVLGAGLGGLAGIKASAEESIDLAGLAVLSSPREITDLVISDGDLAALDMPTLWIGTRTDVFQQVEEMYELAGGEKELWIYEGSALPGTFIFEGADREDFQTRLIEFVSQVLDT